MQSNDLVICAQIVLMMLGAHALVRWFFPEYAISRKDYRHSNPQHRKAATLFVWAMVVSAAIVFSLSRAIALLV